jgi:nucleoside-diphosphate-sugar epimerase
VKTALVTGDKGFIGRHFARYLEGRGWEVLRCDIADGFDVRTLFLSPASLKVDLVAHCAAVVGGRAMIDGAPLALASNLELDVGLFQWALRNQPGRILYFSSSAAYPTFMQAEGSYSLRESDIMPDFPGKMVGTPDQFYGWTKLTGENLAHRARQVGLSVTVVRPFSGYGEDQDDCYPFPAFIDRALRREDPFVIWGDGLQVRDFIHVDDIVRACMVMCDQGIDGPVNLGSGQPVSMRNLAALVCRAAGYRPVFKFDRDAPRGVPYRVCDATRMREFYEPAVSLEEGIARALAWREGRAL